MLCAGLAGGGGQGVVQRPLLASGPGPRLAAGLAAAQDAPPPPLRQVRSQGYREGGRERGREGDRETGM
jgi:hypothetical protein